MKDALDDDLGAIHGPLYLKSERRLPQIVGYTFKAAAMQQNSNFAGALAPNKGNVPAVTSQVLLKAAEVMKRWIETEARIRGGDRSRARGRIRARFRDNGGI